MGTVTQEPVAVSDAEFARVVYVRQREIPAGKLRLEPFREYGDATMGNRVDA